MFKACKNKKNEALYFTFENNCFLLFSELTYSILAIVAMGIFFEGLKYFRELVQSKQVQDSGYGNNVV